MTEDARRSLAPLPALIAAGLVILGVALWMFVDKGWLFVAGLGAFGPGILRELGWLRDQDEFERQAAHHAGYHAYLVGGLAAVLILSALHWSDAGVDETLEWIMIILVALWMTWLFSSLLRYWGARKTASTVLVVFGSFWAVFVLASLLGEAERPDNVVDTLLGALAGTAIVAPFFLLAWTARRSPRRTGAALIVVSALFLVIFAPGRGALHPATYLLTSMLLLLPLVASGIALLREVEPEERDGDRPAPAPPAAVAG